jgi:putative phage-type endonuclease
LAIKRVQFAKTGYKSEDGGKMKTENHQFTTEAEWLRMRSLDVTSTECAALFGKSPYTSYYKLWHSKKNLAVGGSFKETEKMKWGKRLQDAIAEGIAHERGWTIRKMDEYMRLPDLRMGSSFDFAIGDDALLEIKNVGEKAFGKWEVQGILPRAPEHIELQCQHQLAVSGRRVCYIGALVGGCAAHVIERQRDEACIKLIFERVKFFWDTIDSGMAPSPDWDTDSDLYIEQNTFAEPNKQAPMTAEIKKLCTEYSEWSAKGTQVENSKRALKARILSLIGDAELCTGQGYTISAGVVGPGKVEGYERQAYRTFKITAKKGAE